MDPNSVNVPFSTQPQPQTWELFLDNLPFAYSFYPISLHALLFLYCPDFNSGYQNFSCTNDFPTCFLRRIFLVISILSHFTSIATSNTECVYGGGGWGWGSTHAHTQPRSIRDQKQWRAEQSWWLRKWKERCKKNLLEITGWGNR